uniref:Putative Retrovirus-related Pol polyprotein n=1 Tax=Davidia involucrata TaxID=16924 RepID=A0A5B7CIF2_DAVIN
MNSIRILLSLATNLGWSLQQLDVKNVFLHSDLEEEVYMDVPPGFPSPSSEGKVCKLKKSLYDLKQSPRAWFERFDGAMQTYGYQQSQVDHTHFIRHKHDKVTILIVYVDDIVIIGDDAEEMQTLKSYLAKEFEIKDLGSLKYFLRIEVAKS